jgi:hypothetical protein
MRPSILSATKILFPAHTLLFQVKFMRLEEPESTPDPRNASYDLDKTWLEGIPISQHKAPIMLPLPVLLL